MPCTAADNVLPKKTANGCSDEGEEDQKQWCDFLPIQATHCVYYLKFYEQM